MSCSTPSASAVTQLVPGFKQFSIPSTGEPPTSQKLQPLLPQEWVKPGWGLSCNAANPLGAFVMLHCSHTAGLGGKPGQTF